MKENQFNRTHAATLPIHRRREKLPAKSTEPKAAACLTRFAGRSPGETPRHENPQVAGDEHGMREGPCVGMFQ
jgi:hypothetical protein